jgi:hypothetical protein
MSGVQGKDFSEVCAVAIWRTAFSGKSCNGVFSTSRISVGVSADSEHADYKKWLCDVRGDIKIFGNTAVVDRQVLGE